MSTLESVHVAMVTVAESPCSEISCSGLCLGTGDGNVMCDYNVTESKIETDDTGTVRFTLVCHTLLDDKFINSLLL